MGKKFGFMAVTVLAILILLITACSTKTTTSSTKSGSSTNPIATSTSPISTVKTSPAAGTANWWDKFGTPQYGGNLNVRISSLNQTFDPAQMMGGGAWLETLTEMNWTTDRNVWSFSTFWIPVQYQEGWLAKSWEVNDPQTVTVHLREGVKWQNKAPVNGREFTAEDVKYNYDRILGTGSGFDKPNPFFFNQNQILAGVTVKEKYTVEFKLKNPIAVLSLDGGMGGGVFEVPLVPPEWVALGGNTAAAPGGGAPPQGGAPPAGGPPAGAAASALSDWKQVVGTGPWILTDLVEANAMTYTNNPDYYGHDERYPKNKLPYADTMKMIQIPDISTAIATMRTGKLDMIVEMNGGLELRDGMALEKSNPELNLVWQQVQAAAVTMKCDATPFTDIRVRKALQMAVNIPSIGKDYYKGKSPGKPVGLISPVFKDWTVDFDNWPADLQAEYTYNPEGAKKLLAEAGYPNGFQTNVVAPSMQDLELLQVIKSYFMDIGVNMEIRVLDGMAYMNFVSAGKADQMVYFDGGAGAVQDPLSCLSTRLSANVPRQNQSYNNDKIFDALVQQMNTSTDVTKAEQYAKEAEIYMLQQHWAVHSCTFFKPWAWQPWVKGYSGEVRIGSGQPFYLARVWIDQAAKK